MSILIKGMEMPHNGEFKHIRIYDNGDVTVELCDGEAVIAHASPVPPHGRLIDADALRYWSDDSAMIAFDYVTRSQINAAPTIIPAEEGET